MAVGESSHGWHVLVAQTVRDLITRSEQQLLAVRNLGKTSLQDIKDRLAKLGLSIGMKLDGTAEPEADEGAESASEEEIVPSEGGEEAGAEALAALILSAVQIMPAPR